MRDSAAVRGLAVLALAGVAVLLLVPGRTLAVWSDRATIPGTAITSGRVDLQVDGVDEITGFAGLDVPNLLPGRSAATVLTVSNDGDVPLSWTATSSGTDPGDQGLVDALRVKVTGDSATTSTAGGATCAGGALAGSSGVVGGTLVAVPQDLAAGASAVVCVQLRLPVDAADALQGADTEVGLVFSGTTGDVWTDEVRVTGARVGTVTPAAPVVQCGDAVLGGVTLVWAPVPEATGYRLHAGPWGATVIDVPASTHSIPFTGVQGVLTVAAVYGPWVGPSSAGRTYSALAGLLGTCS